ncbi:MAG: hypothetical protein ACK41E_01445 [Deinococcales bacterium]
MNPQLRVLVMNGYDDPATPYWASDDVFDHLVIPAHLRSHLETKYYQAERMMCVHAASHKAMAEDLKGFVGCSIASALAPRRK